MKAQHKPQTKDAFDLMSERIHEASEVLKAMSQVCLADSIC